MKDYELVKYKDKSYYVCRYIKDNGVDKLFIIDKEDLKKILSAGHSFFEINGFIGFTEMVKKKIYQYYLQNIIMNESMEKQEKTFEHISGNIFDNRKVNLKISTQTVKNNKQRERKIKLPENCGVSVDELPTCIFYQKPYGNKGDFFYIEIKGNGKRQKWKSTSSATVTLKDKFIEIKKILLDVAEVYPELIEGKKIIENYSEQQIKLMKQFNRILQCSTYECVEDNLIEIPKRNVVKVNLNEATDNMKKFLEKNNTINKSGHHHKDNFPEDCEITTDMIPSNCTYIPATEGRGDSFRINESHPDLDSEKYWKTSHSQNISTEEKFKQLTKKLKELKKNKSNKKVTKSKNKDKLKKTNISGSKTSKKKVNSSGSKTSKKKTVTKEQE